MMYDPGTLYVDPWLTDFSVGYAPPIFSGLRLFPEVATDTQSGKYRVFDRSRRVRFYSRREPGTVANEVRGGRWSEDSFLTVEHSLQAAVADEENQQFRSLGGLANQAFGGALTISPAEDATGMINDSLLLEHELAVANLARNTASYPAGHSTTLLAADQWDNYAGATSNPLTVLATAIRTIEGKIGVRPNRLVIGSIGIGWLEEHPDVVARFTNFSLRDPEAWKKLIGFEGDLVIIGDDLYNDNDIQEATENLVSVWGKDVILAYVREDLSENDLSFAKTFAQRYLDGTTRPTDRWREEGRKSDLVRTSWKWDIKITSGIAGYVIKDAFSATAW